MPKENLEYTSYSDENTSIRRWIANIYGSHYHVVSLEKNGDKYLVGETNISVFDRWIDDIDVINYIGYLPDLVQDEIGYINSIIKHYGMKNCKAYILEMTKEQVIEKLNSWGISLKECV